MYMSVYHERSIVLVEEGKTETYKALSPTKRKAP